MTQTHAQRIARTEEDMDAAHSMAAHNARQLELTTKLLEQIAALQDEVTRLRDEKRVAEIDYKLHTDALLRETAAQAEVTRLRDALTDSELHCAELQQQLDEAQAILLRWVQVTA